ncbi:hypothetical protein CR513_04289, partial [Mucuna pruriens]
MRQRRDFTPILMTYTTPLPFLLQRGMVAVLPLKPLEPPYPKAYNPNAQCDYHSGAMGHSTERCWSFKHKVQEEEIVQKISQVAVVGQEGARSFQPLIIRCDLIRPEPLILAIPPKPTYENNHAVPWHYDLREAGDVLVEEITNIAEPGGLTRSGRIYTPKKFGKKDPKENPKKTLKKKESEEFLKLIRYSEYELLDHINKTSTLLNKAHVALDITVERFRGIVSNLTSNGRLTFSDEEISTEGKQHNQPVHISVKCGDYMITRVLIDNGSSLNVLPKSTLDKLSSMHSQLKASTVVVRAFDGSRRDVIGEVTLPIYIDPTLFNIAFQVMDIRPAYNCLLGRPWIHEAGVIPSSLHQKVKFISNHQLISIMGVQELVISIPVPEEYIERDEESLETSFQALEFMPDSNAEGASSSSAIEEMAFRVIIREGYQPGKGLGPHLNGIPTPIKIQENKGRAGLGYQRSNQDGNRQLSPVGATLVQHFIRGSMAMIRSELIGQYGRVYASDDKPVNWTTEMLFDEFLFAITNNEPSPNSNMTPMCDDPSPIVESVKDKDAETEALVEMERRIEQERPKFQPLTRELESVNLGNETDKKEIRIGNQMPPELRRNLVELL